MNHHSDLPPLAYCHRCHNHRPAADMYPADYLAGRRCRDCHELLISRALRYQSEPADFGGAYQTQQGRRRRPKWTSYL